MHINRARVACTALLALALATLGLAGTAQAKLVGEFVNFANCDYHNAETNKCIRSITESGEVILGSKTVTIEKPVTLQGGYTFPTEGVSKFVPATNGESLTKAAQNVPGGLLGIVPSASSPPLVKALIKFFTENTLTAVSATLELAKPATEIRVSENNLAAKSGVALEMPVKVHLENPFLGKSCFVGSSGSPIVFKLTTGTTSPPSPNTSISGAGGTGSFTEKLRIFNLKGNKLVDNAWSAPAPTGCGGILSFLVTPIIKAQLGTTTAGHNTAILNNTIQIAAAAAIKKVDETNP